MECVSIPACDSLLSDDISKSIYLQAKVNNKKESLNVRYKSSISFQENKSAAAISLSTKSKLNGGKNATGCDKPVKESFEPCSYIDAFYTYLCYAVLAIVGYINDIVRPRAAAEKYREVSINYVSPNIVWLMV